MENKEAITTLNAIKFLLDNDQYTDDVESALDTAIAALEQQEKAFDEWCHDCKEYDKEQHCCHRFTKVIRQAVEEHRMEWPDSNWIPVKERLPEEDTEVLISYRYKEGEGDTDHVNIDITSYGTTCFGGREIHTLKEWRQPFDYFHANYEVIAWMPLPTPYREE